jgi:ribosome-binding protein aMBF1 (putative translation factor)
MMAAHCAIGLNQTELAPMAGIDPATLSRMEKAGAQPVKVLSRNLEAVSDALRKAGVEMPDENTIRVTKRRR